MKHDKISDLKLKVLREVAEDIRNILEARDLDVQEVCSVMGAITAELILNGDAHPSCWMGFFASFTNTIQANVKGWSSGISTLKDD